MKKEVEAGEDWNAGLISSLQVSTSSTAQKQTAVIGREKQEVLKLNPKELRLAGLLPAAVLVVIIGVIDVI